MNIQQKQEFNVAQSKIFQLECYENVFETVYLSTLKRVNICSTIKSGRNTKFVLLTTADELDDSYILTHHRRC